LPALRLNFSQKLKAAISRGGSPTSLLRFQLSLE